MNNIIGMFLILFLFICLISSLFADGKYLPINKLIHNDLYHNGTEELLITCENKLMGLQTDYDNLQAKYVEERDYSIELRNKLEEYEIQEKNGKSKVKTKKEIDYWFTFWCVVITAAVGILL